MLSLTKHPFYTTHLSYSSSKTRAEFRDDSCVGVSRGEGEREVSGRGRTLAAGGGRRRGPEGEGELFRKDVIIDFQRSRDRGGGEDTDTRDDEEGRDDGSPDHFAATAIPSMAIKLEGSSSMALGAGDGGAVRFKVLGDGVVRGAGIEMYMKKAAERQTTMGRHREERGNFFFN